MQFYTSIITIHIIFAGIWLSSAFLELLFRRKIKKKSDADCSGEVLMLYLNSGNLLGMIGASGILITGIFLVVLNPAYNFFDMSNNHWLATKQIIMVILLIITFIFLVPSAKNLRKYFNSENGKSSLLNNNDFRKVVRFNVIILVLVLINFLLAITHRYIG